MCLCSTSKLIQLTLFVIEHNCLFGRQNPLLDLEVHASVIQDRPVRFIICVYFICFSTMPVPNPFLYIGQYALSWLNFPNPVAYDLS